MPVGEMQVGGAFVNRTTRAFDPVVGGQVGAMATGTVVVVEVVDDEAAGFFGDPLKKIAITAMTMPATTSAPSALRIRRFRRERICSTAIFC